MPMPSRGQVFVKFSLLVVLAAIFTLMSISAQEVSLVLLALIIFGLAFVVICFLSGCPERVLFVCYAATLATEITKGLIGEGGVYSPGLYLSFSDIFLFLLLANQVFQKTFSQPSHESVHPIMKAAALWLLWQWLSAIRSELTLASIFAAINQTKYFLALWLCSNVLRTSQAWRDLLRGLTIGVAFHFLTAMLQVATSGAFQLPGVKLAAQQTISYAEVGLLNLFRPSGMMSHPNALAGYLVLLMPAAVLLLFGHYSFARVRFGAILILGAGLVMLILALSRGGWAALLISNVVVMLPLAMRRKLIDAWQFKRFVVAAIIGVLLIAVAFPAVLLRLTQDDNRSTSSRFLLAEQAILIVERNPVFGVGLGAYAKASRQNLPTSFSAIDPYYRDTLTKSLVHNKYLLVAAETGLLGLLFFLNVFRVAVKHLWRTNFQRDPFRQTLSVGIIAGMVAVLVTFMFEPAERGVPIETLWVALGSAIALTRGRSLIASHKLRRDPTLAVP